MSIRLPELAQKAESHRLKRINEQVKNILSEALIRGDLPSIVSFSFPPTLTHVSVSPDLQRAKVYFSIFQKDQTEETAQKLNAASKHLRHVLSKHMKTKYTPQLFFLSDEHIDVAYRVETLLNSVSKKTPSAS